MTASARTARRRVLFLSGLQIFPPRSGGNLRSFALAGALARHGLDVSVYALVGRKADYLAGRPSSAQDWPDGVREHVDRGLPGFLAQYASYALGLPPLWITAYLRLAAAVPGLLPARLRERLEWCDVVIADFPYLHPVFATAAARGKSHVLSTHNVEHHLLDAETGGIRRRLRRLVRDIEARAAAEADLVVACSTSDAAVLTGGGCVKPTLVVPNGIDRRRFQDLGAHRPCVRRALGLADDVTVLLFTGSKWGPNRDACDFLRGFARERAAWLTARRFHILAVGGMVPRPEGATAFTATGPVDRVEPYFAAADAAVNPMLGGAGTNVKMGEYLALRLPVLTTRFGARGLDLEDGRTALFFERDGLAAALERLRRLFDEDPGRLRRMAERAYADNERAIDMDVSTRPLAEAIEAMAPPAWDRRHEVRAVAPAEGTEAPCLR